MDPWTLVFIPIAALLGFLAGWYWKATLAARELRVRDRRWKYSMQRSQGRIKKLEGWLQEARDSEEASRLERFSLKEAASAAESRLRIQLEKRAQLKAELSRCEEERAGLKSLVAEVRARQKELGNDDELSLAELWALARQRAEEGWSTRLKQSENRYRQSQERQSQKCLADETGVAGDDLQKIRGIGPKIARRLNELGIHTFRQIASWDDADVAWATAKLALFGNRIQREAWVDAARTLCGEADEDRR